MLLALTWHKCNPQGRVCFCWHRRRASRSASCWTAWCEASPPAEVRLDCSHSCQVSSKEEGGVWCCPAGLGCEGCWAPFYWKTKAGFWLEDYLDNQYLLFQLTVTIFILEWGVILATTVSCSPGIHFCHTESSTERGAFVKPDYDEQLFFLPPLFPSPCCNRLIHR